MEDRMEVPQKTKNRIPYDPAISLLGTYLKRTKTLIWKDTCTPMFISALFIIAKVWKQPKCPSTDKCINKIYVYVCERVLVTQSCPTLCNPVDCTPPGSSVHAILQARILEWVAISSSRRSSQPRDWTHVFCTAGRFFTTELPRKPVNYILRELILRNLAKGMVNSEVRT